MSVLVLNGCADHSVVDETKSWSAQHLYAQAMDEMQNGDYSKAAKLLENIEARYPYGHYALQAQLEVAYAYYKNSEPTSAVEACNTFIKLHPNNPADDYAYYLKGLSNFVPDDTVFSRIAAEDPSQRDPKPLIDSFDAFRDLVKKYPNSKYVPDAIERMKYLSNVLADHDVGVALYYYQRRAWVAAVARAQDGLIHFPQAPSNELGLAIMARSYQALGATNLAADSQSVLQKNFPNSTYLDPKTKLIPHSIVQPKHSWWKVWVS